MITELKIIAINNNSLLNVGVQGLKNKHLHS